MGTLSTSGGHLVIDEWHFSSPISLIIAHGYHTQKHFFIRLVSYLYFLKMLVSRKTAGEHHSSAVHRVCLLGNSRLTWHSFFSFLFTMQFIKRCNLVYIRNEFISYIFFIQKAEKESPKYALPFGDICQMNTETLLETLK